MRRSGKVSGLVTSRASRQCLAIDLLVPMTVSPGTGRRAARLSGHGVNVARKVDGLEGVLVDVAEQDIASLDPTVDPRIIRARVLRILQGVSTEDLARRLRSVLGDARSAPTAARAMELFNELFRNRGGEGAIMAARAAQPVLDADQVRLSCEALAGDLLEVLKP